MATTIALVRTSIVNRLKTDFANFGFSANTAIKDYLLDFHNSGEAGTYLMNAVTGKTEKSLRAIGVQVSAPRHLLADDYSGAIDRTYEILVRYYDWLDASGAGVNRVLNAQQSIVSSINSVSPEFGGTSLQVLGEVISEPPRLTVAPQEIPTTQNQMVVGDVRLTARVKPATF